MLNLLFIVASLGIGWLFTRLDLLPVNSHKLINKLLVWIFIPALNFKYLISMSFTTDYIYPLVIPWMVFFGAVGYFFFFKTYLNYSKHTLGALILTGGISSISFVGFPIFQLYYGNLGMSMGIVMSQLGTFLIAMTIGVVIATMLGKESKEPRAILLSMLMFPPFVSTCLALIINIFIKDIPPVVSDFFGLFSQPFAFLALFTVGLQIDISQIFDDKKLLLLGLGYKLMLSPLLVYSYFYLTEELNNTEAKISLLGAALGPMNTAAIIAEGFGLNGALASKMVSVGIPISIISTLIIQYLL